MVTAEGQRTKPTLICSNRHRRRRRTVIIQVASEYVKIGVVEDVKTLRPEFQAEPLGKPEALGDRKIGVPRTRSAERVSASHVGWIGPEVRNAQRRIQRSKASRNWHRQDVEYTRCSARYSRAGMEIRDGSRRCQSGDRIEVKVVAIAVH